MNFIEGDKIKIEIEYSDEVPCVKNLEAIQDIVSIGNNSVVVAGTNFQEGKMTVDKLLAAGELAVNSEKFVLKSFSLSMLVRSHDNPKGSYIEFQANSGIFTHAMREGIKLLNPADKVFFEDIQAQIFDGYENYGSIVKLPGVKITIE